MLQPRAGSGQILPDVVSQPYEVTHRLLILAWDSDACQLACTEQPRQLHGVAPIRLHAVSRSYWDQARRDHLAGDPHLRKLPVQFEPAGTGLVTASQLVVVPHEPLKRSANGLGLVRDVADDGLA